MSINDLLKSLEPKKRICIVCGEEFTGTRVVCSDKCCKYLPLIRERNRELMGLPRDYESLPRKTFLVNKLPEYCSVCNKDVEDLEDHIEKMNDDAHRVLEVMAT